MAGHLLCRLRQEKVAATPEEIVRQKLIGYMIDHLGFPPHALVAEKALSQLPHLDLHVSKLPDRRFDLIAFERARPLLLVECKAVKIQDKEIRQLAGYNYYLQAPYVCLVNQHEIRTGTFDPAEQSYTFEQGLPPRNELLERIKDQG